MNTCTHPLGLASTEQDPKEMGGGNEKNQGEPTQTVSSWQSCQGNSLWQREYSLQMRQEPLDILRGKKNLSPYFMAYAKINSRYRPKYKS